MEKNKITETSNYLTNEIDEMTIIEVLNIINSEDITVPNIINQSISEIEKLIFDILPLFQKKGRLFYIGSGTSGRLGILDAVECPPTFRTNPEKIIGLIAGGDDAISKSIEGAEDNYKDGSVVVKKYDITKGDTLLGISANGSTPFVLGALKQAKINGALTGLITCNNIDRLDYIDHIISIIVGPEIITGSTRMKAGTATKLILNMISTTLMIKLNKTYGNLMVDLNASNKKLWARGIRILVEVADIDSKTAHDVLVNANGEVKTAILMIKNGYEYKEATVILDAANGRLKDALRIK